MTLSTLFLDGQPLVIDRVAVLGEGGEGTVYAHGALAIKLYHAPIAAHGAKLRAFPRGLEHEVVAPVGLVANRAGLVTGYAMPRIESDFDVAALANARIRRGGVDATAVCGLFRRLAEKLRTLHARGVVVGDLNGHNIVVRGDDTFLLDADSMQFGAFACPVGAEETLDPRLYGVDLAAKPAFDPESDAYALSVLWFTSLLYVHPYGGTHPAFPTLLRRAEARVSVFDASVCLPSVAEPVGILSDDLAHHFERVFQHGSRTLPEPKLFSIQFARCVTCGTEHARRICPRCTVSVAVPHVATAPTNALRVVRTRVIARTPGRFVATAYRDRLSYLACEHERLVTSDRTDLGPGPVDPMATFILTAHGVVVASRGALVHYSTRGGAERMGNVDTSAEGTSLVVATRGVVLGVRDGWLVRLDDGVRVGSVFSRTTHLSAGRGLVFGFYRTGDVAIGFICRAAAGGFHHPSLPALRGRVHDVCAAFDDDAVFFRGLTVTKGQASAFARLYDARGTTIAALDGAPGSHPLLSSTTSASAVTVRNGVVLVASNQGLASFSASHAGSFIPRATFDAPHFGDGAVLVPGAPGILYASTPTTLFELTL